MYENFPLGRRKLHNINGVVMIVDEIREIWGGMEEAKKKHMADYGLVE